VIAKTHLFIPRQVKWLGRFLTAVTLALGFEVSAGVLTPDERFEPGDLLQGWRVLDLTELQQRSEGKVVQLRSRKIPFSNLFVHPTSGEVALRSSTHKCLQGFVEQKGSQIQFTWENGDVDVIKPLIKGAKIRLLPIEPETGIQLDFITTMIFVKKPFASCVQLVG
jgi:hypothetical protein